MLIANRVEQHAPIEVGLQEFTDSCRIPGREQVGSHLRQTYGGGYGHDLIKDSRTTFSLLGGLTFVHRSLPN